MQGKDRKSPSHVLVLALAVLAFSMGIAGVHSVLGASTVTVSVFSADLTGNQFPGMFIELQNSAGSDIATGFTPVSFQVTPGQQYIVYANSYQNYVFNHWDDGTTSPARTMTLTQNTTMTAFYSTGTATAPQAPTGLAASAVSSSQINLIWNAPSNNGGSAITGYEIQRSNDSGTSWSVIVANTASTSTAYSDSGLASSTTYEYQVYAINGAGTSPASNVASATTSQSSNSQVLPITKSQSGLVGSDPLDNETMSQQQLLANQQYWTYTGDAIKEGAPYQISKDSGGLHIGVEAKTAGKYAGFFAVSPNTSAELFHVVVGQPVRTIPADDYNNGIYVQTTQASVNYVTCTVDSTPSGAVWSVVGAIGSRTSAHRYVTFWQDTSANQPLVRDCTIITNGSNYLKVYIDGTMVYTSSSLVLDMPAPFNAYLEPETSYAGQVLDGTYADYYATSGEKIEVTNIPSNAARVEISSASGSTLASATPSGGTAILDVGQYHFPLAATINVYDANNMLIASGTASIYGGDAYSVG